VAYFGLISGAYFGGLFRDGLISGTDGLTPNASRSHPRLYKPDWGTKSYLIETMVELLGSKVPAGKGEFALTAIPIANGCAVTLLGTPLNPLDK
jgi:hypothetical protein